MFWKCFFQRNNAKIIPKYLERINLLPTFAPVNKER